MRKALEVLLVLASLLALCVASAQAAELVMFDDPTCVWCRKWLREVGPGYPHSDEGQLAPLRRIDIKNQTASGVALKTSVTATPTFVVADDEGREIGRITGYPGADFFYPALDEILAKLPGKARGKPALRETHLITGPREGEAE